MKPDMGSNEKESPSLLTKSGKVRPGGLITKKPMLNKFGSQKANGLPRKGKM